MLGLGLAYVSRKEVNKQADFLFLCPLVGEVIIEAINVSYKCGPLLIQESDERDDKDKCIIELLFAFLRLFKDLGDDCED